MLSSVFGFRPSGSSPQHNKKHSAFRRPRCPSFRKSFCLHQICAIRSTNPSRPPVRFPVHPFPSRPLPAPIWNGVVPGGTPRGRRETGGRQDAGRNARRDGRQAEVRERPVPSDRLTRPPFPARRPTAPFATFLPPCRLPRLLPAPVRCRPRHRSGEEAGEGCLVPYATGITRRGPATSEFVQAPLSQQIGKLLFIALQKCLCQCRPFWCFRSGHSLRIRFAILTQMPSLGSSRRTMCPSCRHHGHISESGWLLCMGFSGHRSVDSDASR